MTDVGALNAEGRARITELVSGLDAGAAAATSVPTCPEWSVQDLVAHLAGVCADVLAGNIEGVATEAWTAAQVEARRGRSLDEVLAEWAEAAPPVEAMARHFPGRVGSQWVLDLHTHEHDIRTALGVPGARTSEGVRVGLEFLVVVGLDPALSVRGLGPLELRTEDGSWVVGSAVPASASATFDSAVAARAAADAVTSERLLGGEVSLEGADPVGSVAASGFEFFRALTGRRSRAQIAGFDWSVHPEPYLDAFEFGPFTLSAADVEE